jgi:hypothetical protein
MKSLAFLLIVLFSLLKPFALFAGGVVENKPAEVKVVTELQDRYNALTAPGMVMLPISGISAVALDFLVKVENELYKQFVNDGKIKPVKIQSWLLSKYANKADNPFTIINAIKAEQFSLPLQYIGRPVVFMDGDRYYFVLYVYQLETYYPIIIFRQLASLDTLNDMVASCIEELHLRLSRQSLRSVRKRVIVEDFKLEFFRLVEQKDEFEFISAPFIEKKGMVFKEGDDFFSRIMGYVLTSTNLFQVFQAGDFKEYSNVVISNISTMVDYRVQGRVQLTEQECVLYVDVLDVRSGAKIISLRYPLLSYSFEEVWNIYRKISVQIITRLFDKESYGIIPNLASPGRSFFANNMFVGWNKLEDFVLARGLHIISTGSSYRIAAGNNTINSYHIILDNQIMVYTNKEGRRIWNLLNK